MNDQIKMPASLSLVMIVRDEAKNIKQLLSGLAPISDEVIVVDTGSTDDTVTLATGEGALVFNFPWCDDFAAARNFGLVKASKSWILAIDADERIAPADFPVIKSAIQTGTPKGFFFTQRNYTNLTNHPEWRPNNQLHPELEEGTQGFIEAHQIRLFPNLPELRYEGCIHETVHGFCKAAIKKEHLEVTIHHFGHIQSGAAANRRNDLYRRLTREKLRQNPNDGEARYQMAIRHIEEGFPDQGRALLESFAAESSVDHPSTTRAIIALGRILLGEGKVEAALEKFELAVQQKPEWLLCWMDTISALVNSGRWSDAAKFLAGARMIFPNEALLLRFECRLLIATGSYLQAAEKADQLARQYPHWPGARELAQKCRKIVEKDQ